MSIPAQFETDVIPTAAGDLQITFLGHASLLLTWQGQSFYVDPFGEMADYTQLPPATAVLITHEHADHCDPVALAFIRTDQTEVVLTEACARQGLSGTVMRNGETRGVAGVPVEAVPAYNRVHKRPNGQPFHLPGVGNGYILTFGDQRVYVAGDTENIPEMHRLTGLACAFLPMNLPFTMTPEMVAEVTKVFRPRILYPYHYGDTDPERLAILLRGEKNIEVRIRRMA